MANLKPIFTAGAVLFALAACGAKLPHKTSDKQTSPGITPNAGVYLDHQFMTTEGSKVDLAQLRDKPVVFIFSSDSCLSCSEEATALVASLKNPTQNPPKVHLFTVLIEASPDEAIAWKNKVHVPWTVGMEDDVQYFFKMCPAREIPCTVVQTPQNGIVLQKVGVLKKEDVTPLTGDWE